MTKLIKPGKLVDVTYHGNLGNHYVPSPGRFVRTYGYHSRGDVFQVFEGDIELRPDLFTRVGGPAAASEQPVEAEIAPEGLPAEEPKAVSEPEPEPESPGEESAAEAPDDAPPAPAGPKRTDGPRRPRKEI
jgi:hypothetical protein